MKKIWWMIRLALAAGCYILAVRYSVSAEKNAGIITAFLEGEALDQKTAETVCGQEAEREDALSLCIWGEQDNASLNCRETGNGSSVSLILTAGRPDLVIPGSGVLVWQENGCFIDTSTAVELFGTEQAAGQTVWCQDTAYTVCGTFESLRQLMVRQVRREDEKALTAVSVWLPERKNVEAAMEQLLMRNGLAGKTVEFVFLSSFANDLLLLVPVILALRLLYLLLLPGKKYAVSAYPDNGPAPAARKRCGGILRILLCAVIAAGILWLAGERLEIPADMIPSKWSDFSFWTSWWEQQRQNMLRIIGTAQGEMQLTMIWNMAASLLCNTAAVCLALSMPLADTSSRLP